MAIYYITIAIMLIGGVWVGRDNNDSERKKGWGVYCLAIAILLIAIMGLRSLSVGNDTFGYFCKYGNYSLTGSDTEILYKSLNVACFSAGIDWQMFLVIVSALMVFPLAVFVFRYSTNPAFSFVIFLTIGAFSMDMSGLRQGIAMSICLLAFMALEKKKYLLFVSLVLIAYLFHNSALVVLVLFPLSFLKMNRKTVLLLAGILVLAFFFRRWIAVGITLISPERYSDYSLSGYSINPILIALNGMLLIFPLYCCRERLSKGDDRDLNLLFLASFVNMFFYMIAPQGMYFVRLAYYFSFSNIVLQTRALDQTRGKEKFILGMCLIGMCILAFSISTPGGRMQIDNYSFFWTYGQ